MFHGAKIVMALAATGLGAGSALAGAMGTTSANVNVQRGFSGTARAVHGGYTRHGSEFGRFDNHRPGKWQGRDRHRRRPPHPFGGYGGVWGYGYALPVGYYPGYYPGFFPEADYFGYFRTDGTADKRNGQAVYDYDRGYPYEWFNGRARTAPSYEAEAARFQPEASSFEPAVRPSRTCETQMVADGRGQAPVRICRY